LCLKPAWLANPYQAGFIQTGLVDIFSYFHIFDVLPANQPKASKL